LDALGASPDAGVAVRTALLTRARRPHASASAAS
jgi:hypothetical protein